MHQSRIPAIVLNKDNKDFNAVEHKIDPPPAPRQMDRGCHFPYSTNQWTRLHKQIASSIVNDIVSEIVNDSINDKN